LRDPTAVAERLLAVQGQDPRGFRLAIRARTEGLSAADVERALGDRALLVTWLNRGTLHLVRSEDYPWLHALTTPPLLTSSARRLSQEGVPPDDADRAVATIERALAEEGPLTRAQLKERLDTADAPTGGQALIHLLFLVTLRGIAVRGPVVGKQHAYVLTRDWLGEPKAVDRDTALAELARRYLVGHAPRLRSGAARLDLAGGDHRSPHRPGHPQRDLPPLRPRRRPSHRQVAVRQGRGQSGAVRADSGRRRGGTRGRRR
jgi:hypothetical protein